jgi:hypothetical protein
MRVGRRALRAVAATAAALLVALVLWARRPRPAVAVEYLRGGRRGGRRRRAGRGPRRNRRDPAGPADPAPAAPAGPSFEGAAADGDDDAEGPAAAAEGPRGGTGDAGGGPRTDQTNLSFTDSNGVTSRYHRYAAGLDWSKPVGLLVYTDGSGEYGLKNPSSGYLLAGPNGLVQVAKRNNMVLLTPLAPGAGCGDGDGVCWYMPSSNISPANKARWSAELVKHVQRQYGTVPNRVAIGGYSSGAQWTTEYFGPLYASEIMTGGVAVAISYGGSPKVPPKYTAAFKSSVPFVWDTGARDSAYTGGGSYGVKAGHAWYTANGFKTQLVVVPGLGHGRPGQFGAIMEREIKKHVPR